MTRTRGPGGGAGAGAERVSYRALQAQETRRRIAGAARRRFAAAGYACTTVEAVAAEAGVAASTVYAAFKTKAALLAAGSPAPAGRGRRPAPRPPPHHRRGPESGSSG